MPTVTVTTGGETAACTYTLASDPVPVGAVAMPAGNGVDDTAALVNCVRVALAAAARPRVGPSGEPQAVVYIPPGVYRINWPLWPSHLCVMVHAAAVIQLPAGAGKGTGPGGSWGRASMLMWGAESNNPTQVRNVSLLTVGRDVSLAKQAFLDADPILAAKVDVGSVFTSQHDAAVTGATNNALVLDMCNVTWFEFGGVFQIHNATNGPDNGTDNYPTSSICGVAIRAAKQSPLGDPAGFLQPRHGRIGTLAATTAPRGYGPTQINACTDVTIGTVASLGGTAFRVETDGSLISKNTGGMDRGATVDQLACGTAVSVAGNRAAAFTPHGQINGTVRLGAAFSVRSFQTVVASKSNRQGGSFTDVTVDTIDATGGTGAQGQGTTNLWVDGVLSDASISIDGGLAWLPNLHLPAPVRRGAFATAK